MPLAKNISEQIPRDALFINTKDKQFESEPELSYQWLYDKVQALIGGDEIDPEENLLIYGLDSLRMMRLASELNLRGIKVTFEELGHEPTVANWWILLQKKQKAIFIS